MLKWVTSWTRLWLVLAGLDLGVVVFLCIISVTEGGIAPEVFLFFFLFFWFYPMLLCTYRGRPSGR